MASEAIWSLLHRPPIKLWVFVSSRNYPIDWVCLVSFLTSSGFRNKKNFVVISFSETPTSSRVQSHFLTFKWFVKVFLFRRPYIVCEYVVPSESSPPVSRSFPLAARFLDVFSLEHQQIIQRTWQMEMRAARARARLGPRLS